jgi:hypothetical protein
MTLKVKRPLPKGTKISWTQPGSCSKVVSVIEDNIKHNSITVQTNPDDPSSLKGEWQWECQGIECKVVSYPKPEVKPKTPYYTSTSATFYGNEWVWPIWIDDNKTIGSVGYTKTRSMARKITKLLNEENNSK